MAKTVSEKRIAIVFELVKESNEPLIITARVDYVVTSDDLSEARTYSPEIGGSLETRIKTLAQQFLVEIKDKEE